MNGLNVHVWARCSSGCAVEVVRYTGRPAGEASACGGNRAGHRPMARRGFQETWLKRDHPASESSSCLVASSPVLVAAALAIRL